MRMHSLTYAGALREATSQLLAADDRVFVIGQGLWSPWYVGTSMKDLDVEFGRSRIIDSPVCENATTAIASGAAITGMRPILVHPRMDFMLLAMDPIINQASNWCYLFAGQVHVPLVIRPIINRGGQQGAQHSQAMQALLQHIPGLKVVMPSTPFDAKGLLIAASRDGNPVVYIDDRWLYEEQDDVPEEMYEVPIGAAAVRREGDQVTIVASSWMARQSVRAADALAERGIDAEIIDLRSLKPWDRQRTAASVRKTGRLVIADGTFATGGVSSEIAAVLASACFGDLKAPMPAPTSKTLEAAYYPNADSIVAAAEVAVGRRKLDAPHRPCAELPGQILVA